MADPISIVREFCDTWSTGDLDAIVAFFTDDAMYHNIPMAPVSGRDAIRETIAGFMGGVQQLSFRVAHIAAAGDVVLTERVDVFDFGASTIELPVSGTFELRDGKIAAWRDYFDLNMFMSQMPK
ncbi:MAG: limonene,2-epoxide hydrolase [Actinomycetota bacterium]|jgi:limonene-1,2-epoxide hydrolase|nr:limonene,2-epoxide hydrolase [Actinomycetota bacterium]